MYIKIVLAVLIIAFVGAQFVPVERTNPSATGEIEAPVEVSEILKRSCYDCHSNETVWPWYSSIAPVSWLVISDVNEAREHMNFTEWNKYSPKKKGEKVEKIWEEVEDGDMPLWYYVPLHPEVKLSAADKELLHKWTAAAAENDYSLR